MSLSISCDQIISRLKRKSEEIDSIKADIKNCFAKLDKESDGKRRSFDFGLRFLTAISTSIPKQKSEWTSNDWNVTEIVSLVLECHDHLLKTDFKDVNLSLRIYSIFSTILDVDSVEASVVSSRLLEDLEKYVTSESATVISIARNCFAKLWNTAILYEGSRSTALKMRLESLSYLSFSSSEASKFCSKAVHALQAYAAAVASSKDYFEANNFTFCILNMFRERFMDETVDDLALTEGVINIIRMTLQLFLNGDQFDLASSLLEKAREMLPKRNRSIVTFELDVFESFYGLSSILMQKSTESGSVLEKTSKLLNSCISYLTNGDLDDDFLVKDKRLPHLIYFIRLRLRTISEKVYAKLETSLNILQCVRPLLNFIRTIARVTKHVSIDDSLQLCHGALFLNSYVLRALADDSEMLVEIVGDGQKLVKTLATIVTKLTTEKLSDGISQFLASSQTMINSLYYKKMYVECLPFVYPYVGLLLQSYDVEDETKTIQFWKRMSGLVFCLNRAEKFKEALQVIAEFLAKDMGQDKEAMALWVSVKREAVRTNVETMTNINTRSLVSPLLRTNSESKRIRLVSLLKQELEAFKVDVFDFEDVLHAVISDLMELVVDPLDMSYALVQMARFLLYRDPDYDRKWNPTKCCREALKQLERSKRNKKTVFVFGSTEDNLEAQAKFILYLAGMQIRYVVLEEKVSKQEAKLRELRNKQRENAQKANPAASEKMDDLDDGDEVSTYDSSTIEEELQVLAELDSCVQLWRSILDANSEVPPFVVDILRDLRCATEIYATARFYSQEVSTWELFLMLAKRSERWSDYIDGVARFSTTLARLGLTDRAESLLKETTTCMKYLDETDHEVQILSVCLLLAQSELYLMKNDIAKGWEQLRLAKSTIKESRRTKSVMLLNSVALALESKYCELPTFVHLDLFERETTPVESMSAAVRLCSSLLNSCIKDGPTMTMLFKQRLLGCIVEFTHRLGQLHYNLGSIRDARCFLREMSSWSRQFFFVNRTVDVILLQSRMDLIIEDKSMCQVKLNEVQHIMDSLDVTSSTIGKKSDVEKVEIDEDQDDGYRIMSPVRSERYLTIPSTMVSLSPCLSDKRAISSLKEHDGKCKCAKCKHIVVHQLRAECLFVRHELMDMPVESTREILKRAKRASLVEKALIAKFGNGTPISQIEIRFCWMMSRMVEKQLEDGSVRAALSLVTTALKMLNSFHRDGIGSLHFLNATLTYQKCVAQLLLLCRREGNVSISQFYDKMWTTSMIRNVDAVEDLTLRIADIGIGKPNFDFKTPKNRPPSNRIQKRDVDSTAKIQPIVVVKKGTTSSVKKRVQFTCAAPMKKRPQMSIFENVFSPQETDTDNDVATKQDNHTIIISDNDNNDSPTVFTSDKSPCVTSKRKESSKTRKKSSSKGVIDRFKASTISDKENSDSEDFSPLKSLCKRRPKLNSVLDVINVDFEGSPIRNLTPKRDVEKVRDEEDTELEKLPSKRTTRKVTTKSVVVDTVGRRTRSRLASVVEDIEINRGESPDQTKKKKMKKKIVTKESYVRSPGFAAIVETEADLEFTMDELISTLDKAVRCVEHHPHVPLYGDLNLLLALCKGERNVNSTGHILESVGITLRHYACDRFGNTMRSLTGAVSSTDDNSERITSNMEIRRKLIGFSEGSLKFNDDGSLKRVTDKLPKDWVVCQINKLPDILTGSTENSELFLTRLENGHKPVVAKINCSDRTRGARDFLSELNDILSEMKSNVRLTSPEAWWKSRREFDSRLKTLLQSMEDVCLGPWKCLLLGRPNQESDRKKLKEATKQILCDIVPLKLPFVNRHLLELVIDSWPWLKPEHLNVALGHLCSISASDSRLRKMCSIVNDRIRELWSIGMSRKVVILILDKTLHYFPWESLPILRPYPVSRMPSLHFLLGHLALHFPFEVSDTMIPTVDPLKSSFYILNPGGDLIRTQNYLDNILNKELKWPGITGRPPTKDEWTNTLSTKDLFVYCGHGAGSAYASGEVIEKKGCRATTILMGCSSAQITKQGRNLEAHGIILQYLIAGCPCVMGNLWDVTDKDIDKLTETLVKKWIPEPDQKDKCILDCLSLARDVTIMKYLIGSAPVTYGIPVYSRTTC